MLRYTPPAAPAAIWRADKPLRLIEQAAPRLLAFWLRNGI
jgi:hypothetical protein